MSCHCQPALRLLSSNIFNEIYIHIKYFCQTITKNFSIPNQSKWNNARNKRMQDIHTLSWFLKCRIMSWFSECKQICVTKKDKVLYFTLALSKTIYKYKMHIHHLLLLDSTFTCLALRCHILEHCWSQFQGRQMVTHCYCFQLTENKIFHQYIEEPLQGTSYNAWYVRCCLFRINTSFNSNHYFTLFNICNAAYRFTDSG